MCLGYELGAIMPNFSCLSLTSETEITFDCRALLCLFRQKSDREPESTIYFKSQKIGESKHM